MTQKTMSVASMISPFLVGSFQCFIASLLKLENKKSNHEGMRYRGIKKDNRQRKGWEIMSFRLLFIATKTGWHTMVKKHFESMPHIIHLLSCVLEWNMSTHHIGEGRAPCGNFLILSFFGCNFLIWTPSLTSFIST